MSIKDLARRAVRALTPYQSARRIGGKGNVWLNANEAPIAYPFTIDPARLNRYPECQPPQVIAAYAGYAGVQPEQVLASRGADEAIELVIRTFCEAGQDQVLICPPTYGMYAISAETCGVGIVEVPLKPSRQPDWSEIKSRLSDVKVVFLCSPNNPTGDLVGRDGLINLLEAATDRALIVVDEAYIEFCPEASVVDLIARYPNLVVTRTLSKAFALAGIRCGFTLASQEVIGMLAKVIAPYPIPDPVAQIAAEALSPSGLALMQERVGELNAQKARIKAELQALPCVTEIFEDKGNFVLVRFSDGERVFAAMKQAGIILRDFSSKPGLADAIRITIGYQDEMDAVLNVLRDIR
ncbi:histidinol-phosphate transaminase [Aeromonas simiae]|uniref:histidinol-phosphate transaminase n=1 Tax=Aeromonas simiae TaxID=218936 RepID=UPI00266BC197|nr:histidinol-phosphate transaminase [Aeromonas simiae]MDO2948016.1 histidinol-phosphate transaminase [Aeromonas simiae]MDO2952267.1 histidinol-phosphate transaminase [Aeromonas simiae]MDO2955399.1 histidinol-phosphate transaminase [Aeromonas simiae]